MVQPNLCRRRRRRRLGSKKLVRSYVLRWGMVLLSSFTGSESVASQRSYQSTVLNRPTTTNNTAKTISSAAYTSPGQTYSPKMGWDEHVCVQQSILLGRQYQLKHNWACATTAHAIRSLCGTIDFGQRKFRCNLVGFLSIPNRIRILQVQYILREHVHTA